MSAGGPIEIEPANTAAADRNEFPDGPAVDTPTAAPTTAPSSSASVSAGVQPSGGPPPPQNDGFLGRYHGFLQAGVWLFVWINATVGMASRDNGWYRVDARTAVYNCGWQQCTVDGTAGTFVVALSTVDSPLHHAGGFAGASAIIAWLIATACVPACVLMTPLVRSRLSRVPEWMSIRNLQLTSAIGSLAAGVFTWLSWMVYSAVFKAFLAGSRTGGAAFALAVLNSLLLLGVPAAALVVYYLYGSKAFEFLGVERAAGSPAAAPADASPPTKHDARVVIAVTCALVLLFLIVSLGGAGVFTAAPSEAVYGVSFDALNRESQWPNGTRSINTRDLVAAPQLYAPLPLTATDFTAVRVGSDPSSSVLQPNRLQYLYVRLPAAAFAPMVTRVHTQPGGVVNLATTAVDSIGISFGGDGDGGGSVMKVPLATLGSSSSTASGVTLQGTLPDGSKVVRISMGAAMTMCTAGSSSTAALGSCTPVPWTAFGLTGGSTGSASTGITTGQNSQLAAACGSVCGLQGTACASSCEVCSSAQTVAGADEPITRYFTLQSPDATFVFAWDTVNIKDRITVTSPTGGLLFDSGCVGSGGTRTEQLSIRGGSAEVRVDVFPNCDCRQATPCTGTAWQFELTCTATQCLIPSTQTASLAALAEPGTPTTYAATKIAAVQWHAVASNPVPPPAPQTPRYSPRGVPGTCQTCAVEPFDNAVAQALLAHSYAVYCGETYPYANWDCSLCRVLNPVSGSKPTIVESLYESTKNGHATVVYHAPGSSSGRGLAVALEGCILLTFRGTDSVYRYTGDGTEYRVDVDSGVNFDLLRTPAVDYPYLMLDSQQYPGAKVHSGFSDKYHRMRGDVLAALDRVWSRVLAMGQTPRFVYVTGHSQGAGIATFAFLDVRRYVRDRATPFSPCKVLFYSFGAPRVGNAAAATAITADATYYRVTNDYDAIVQLPPTWVGYRHAGTEVYLTAGTEAPVVLRPATDPLDGSPIESLAGNNARSLLYPTERAKYAHRNYYRRTLGTSLLGARCPNLRVCTPSATYGGLSSCGVNGDCQEGFVDEVTVVARCRCNATQPPPHDHPPVIPAPLPLWVGEDCDRPNGVAYGSVFNTPTPAFSKLVHRPPPWPAPYPFGSTIAQAHADRIASAQPKKPTQRAVTTMALPPPTPVVGPDVVAGVVTSTLVDVLVPGNAEAMTVRGDDTAAQQQIALDTFLQFETDLRQALQLRSADTLQITEFRANSTDPTATVAVTFQVSQLTPLNCSVNANGTLLATSNNASPRIVTVDGGLSCAVVNRRGDPPSAALWRNQTAPATLLWRNQTLVSTVFNVSDTLAAAATGPALTEDSTTPAAGLSAGAIAGAVLGTVLGAAALVALAYWIWTRNSSAGDASQAPPPPVPTAGAPPQSQSSAVAVGEEPPIRPPEVAASAV